MLTRLLVRNFKRFEELDIPLSSPVVFVGPNNSGKTTALQALALWDIGLRRWREKRSGRLQREKRPGVAINRRDLLSIPVPSANLLWRALRTRALRREASGKAKQTQNIRIEILVQGRTGGQDWECGLEFDFSNSEVVFCRPTQAPANPSRRMPVPEIATAAIAYLPPMSGLTTNETKLEAGAVNVRLGEGRTAEVLRNLCYQISSGPDGERRWAAMRAGIERLFGVELHEPQYVQERGEIQMSYREGGVELDLASAGRGLHQTLLLLAYLDLHPGSVLLLDEPDAHLEILRQAEIFRILNETARKANSQLIVATHSEVVLNDAVEVNEEGVIAFIGQPHQIPPRRVTALRRALQEYRFDQYVSALQTGWVLYLEDRTDLDILKAFARRLAHPADEDLEMPFLHPIGNQPNRGRQHFDALIEAKPDLQGFLLVDSDAGGLQERGELREYKWARREIENYICQLPTLEAFAKEYSMEKLGGPLFADGGLQAMREAIRDNVAPARLADPNGHWWRTMKASDELLDLVMPAFCRRLGLGIEIRKPDYHLLVRHIPEDLVDPEVIQVLDAIHEVAQRARPGA